MSDEHTINELASDLDALRVEHEAETTRLAERIYDLERSNADLKDRLEELETSLHDTDEMVAQVIRTLRNTGHRL